MITHEPLSSLAVIRLFENTNRHLWHRNKFCLIFSIKNAEVRVGGYQNSIYIRGYWTVKTLRTTAVNNFGLGSCLTDITCPAGWWLFNGSCYFLSSQTGPWKAGREDCKTRGAHLVIITSKKNRYFIEGLKVAYWIGLTDVEQEGTWKWVDGSAFIHFAPAPPDNGNGDPIYGEEDCALMFSTGGWNDRDCNQNFPWICEQ
uniref:C-type lectin domain-containing protein n=1 Tax=Sphaeramia orbicularis TaxID=375764 RepID=A0A673CMY1_9TELE